MAFCPSCMRCSYIKQWQNNILSTEYTTLSSETLPKYLANRVRSSHSKQPNDKLHVSAQNRASSSTLTAVSEKKSGFRSPWQTAGNCNKFQKSLAHHIHTFRIISGGMQLTSSSYSFPRTKNSLQTKPFSQPRQIQHWTQSCNLCQNENRGYKRDITVLDFAHSQYQMQFPQHTAPNQWFEQLDPL